MIRIITMALLVLTALACVPRRAPGPNSDAAVTADLVLAFGSGISELVSKTEAESGRTTSCVIAALASAAFDAARDELRDGGGRLITLLPELEVDVSRCAVDGEPWPIDVSRDTVPTAVPIILDAVAALADTSPRCEVRAWGGAVARVLDQLLELVDEALAGRRVPPTFTLTAVRLDVQACE